MRMWNKTWIQIFLRMIDVIWEIKYYWLHTYAVSRKIIRTSTLQEIWHDEIGISFWEIEKLIEFHFTVVVIGSIYEHSIPNSNQLDLPEVLDRFYLSSVFKKKPEPNAHLVNSKRKRYV